MFTTAFRVLYTGEFVYTVHNELVTCYVHFLTYCFKHVYNIGKKLVRGCHVIKHCKYTTGDLFTEP